MRVRYNRRAVLQLAAIFDYIAADNPMAAAAVTRRVETVVALIGRYPAMGRPTDKPGVRVLSIPPYPYVIFYKVSEDRGEVRVLRVRHTARRPD